MNDIEKNIVVDKKVMTMGIMSVIHHEMSRENLLKREYISPIPVLSQGEYQMIIVSTLLDRRKDEVGDVRVFVFVPETDAGSVLVRVEWTKELFGFWFRNQIRINQGNFDLVKVSDFIKDTVDKIRHTIDRDISLKSQVRTLKKIKKNQTRDKALRSGLVLG